MSNVKQHARRHGRDGDHLEVTKGAALSSAPAREPMTDEQIDAAALAETGFDGVGTQEMNAFDVRRIARAIERHHGICESEPWANKTIGPKALLLPLKSATSRWKFTPKQRSSPCLRNGSAHEHYGMAFYSPPPSDRISDIEREWEAKAQRSSGRVEQYRGYAEKVVIRAANLPSDAEGDY